jgi:hypothetical protein
MAVSSLPRLALLTRFAVTRGQPLDPAEGRGPSDSLVFKLAQAYGKMFRDARLSSGEILS